MALRPTLAPAAWVHHDWPEQVIGADAWLEMYRTAGLFAWPNIPDLQRAVRMWPSSGEMTLYRVSTVARAPDMWWVLLPDLAEPFRVRAERTVGGDSTIFRTNVAYADVLALLFHAADGGGVEYVVDPGGLPSELDRIGLS